MDADHQDHSPEPKESTTSSYEGPVDLFGEPIETEESRRQADLERSQRMSANADRRNAAVAATPRGKEVYQDPSPARREQTGEFLRRTETDVDIEDLEAARAAEKTEERRLAGLEKRDREAEPFQKAAREGKPNLETRAEETVRLAAERGAAARAAADPSIRQRDLEALAAEAERIKANDRFDAGVIHSTDDVPPALDRVAEARRAVDDAESLE